MFFKNLQVYRFTENIVLPSTEALDNILAVHAARSCGDNELSTFGWGELRPYTRSLVSNGRILLAADKTERLLPTVVVNQELAKQVAAKEAEENRKLPNKERGEIKFSIINRLLPQAFLKTSRTYAYIDMKNNWLVVDYSSANKAEDVLSLLRKTLGSLPVECWIPTADVGNRLSDWVSRDSDIDSSIPGFLTIDSDCELKIRDGNKTKITCKNKNLFAADVKESLDSGFAVSKLALTWEDRISFILTDDLQIKRIKFLDFINEHPEYENEEDSSLADFTIMTGEFANLLSDLDREFCAKEEGII
jgi:recombination associated protein RdgC